MFAWVNLPLPVTADGRRVAAKRTTDLTDGKQWRGNRRRVVRSACVVR